jgi:CRISPR-associated protein Csb1
MTPQEQPVEKITPQTVLEGESPLVLTATLAPVAGLDRFQPAGFPEIGHVIYKAPRANGSAENVCIVDSAASMANHLESVCLRGAHDYELVDDLAGMPYLRCVTNPLTPGGEPDTSRTEVIVTSLTEGHRIASDYFLNGRLLNKDTAADKSFREALADEMGIVPELRGQKNAHPPAEAWWNVFQTIFSYDPNALVHGVFFPKWWIRIPRLLTAHLEAFGSARVDRSGVKFDRIGKTTSGQPIFAVDDATAREIRATFILDVSLLRSFGRAKLGLDKTQKEFLSALALWKIHQLLASPFRYRSGCYLALESLKHRAQDAEIYVNIGSAITNAHFANGRTDIFWPREELYRKGQAEEAATGAGTGDDEEEEDEGDE